MSLYKLTLCRIQCGGHGFYNWSGHTLHVGTFPGIDPLFEICRSVPFYAQLDLIDSPPPLQNKIGLYLSHLVPEIIWPEIGQIFLQNTSFDQFQHFVPICSLIFDFVHPILIFLRSFWLLFFLQNLRSCWVHFFSSCTVAPTKHLVMYPSRGWSSSSICPEYLVLLKI